MVEIPVPAELKGKSDAEVKKLFETFLKQRTNTQVRDKAVRNAQKDLQATHADEFAALVEKYSK